MHQEHKRSPIRKSVENSRNDMVIWREQFFFPFIFWLVIPIKLIEMNVFADKQSCIFVVVFWLPN